MRKYGFLFEPVAGRSGWFAANEVVEEAALEAARRVHNQTETGAELVFCGRGDDGIDRLYLVQTEDLFAIAIQFQLGSSTLSATENVVAETLRMLTAVSTIAPLTPVLISSTAFEGRFNRRLDQRLAEQVLKTIEHHGAHGMDYYASRFPDLTDEEIVRSLVDEQRLHLWWD
jgi:hypothetical protein